MQGYQRVWQIESIDKDVVLEPHYSAFDLFAYRAAEPSFWRKLLGLFGGMFLHGSFDHLLGNLLFLWVFGRALEDTFGPLIYLGSYLLAGVAATLLYHVITTQFTPQTAGMPLMGASGAIAGVMGLFATRFYRTPVVVTAVMLVLPIVTWTLSSVLILLTGGKIWSLLLSFGGAVAFWVLCGKRWGWDRLRVPSAWAIGSWLIVLNILPGVLKLFSTEKEGGVAYWAHIGGFCFGMVYALLIGSTQEGGREYLLEDAQKAYQAGDAKVAVERAQNLLGREPNNAGAREVLALANDRLHNSDAALDNYEIAIDAYLKGNEREEAARLYREALRGHARFMLKPAHQLAVGNQMAQDADWQNAAETLVKIPYTFPDAPESEIALLRGAQIYLERLQQPQTAEQLLSEFAARYPDSQWMPQTQRAWNILRAQKSADKNAPS